MGLCLPDRGLDDSDEFAACGDAEDRLIPGRGVACEEFKDIVKRECDCWWGESLSSAVMFGKHTAVGSETTRSLVFLRP